MCSHCLLRRKQPKGEGPGLRPSKHQCDCFFPSFHITWIWILVWVDGLVICFLGGLFCVLG
uniref:Uncharacterized protein n=1 Tax=Arundo donax TaxID=35708 RepID=A0A0A9DRJ1_ARUDO